MRGYDRPGNRPEAVRSLLEGDGAAPHRVPVRVRRAREIGTCGLLRPGGNRPPIDKAVRRKGAMTMDIYLLVRKPVMGGFDGDPSAEADFGALLGKPGWRRL